MTIADPSPDEPVPDLPPTGDAGPIADPRQLDDLLRRAIGIGENMIRIADAVGQPLAGNYFSIGLDILRRAAGEPDPRFDDLPPPSDR